MNSKLEIRIASTSALKLKAVKLVADQLSISVVQSYLEVTSTKVQPIGETEILKAASTRIENVLNFTFPSRWVLALENGLVIRNGVWYDDCLCLIRDVKTGEEIKAYTRIKIDLTSINDHLQSYLALGKSNEMTFGSYLCDVLDLSSSLSNNWMKEVSGIDRIDQMVDAIKLSLNEAAAKVLNEHIRYVENFPTQGILFKDLMPLLYDPIVRKIVTYRLSVLVKECHSNVDAILGPELRGCIFGPLVASMLDLPFLPLRKKGKLPPPVKQIRYGKEYGTDALEVDASNFYSLEGKKVVIVDDVLATGGSLKACAELVESLGGEVVGMVVLQSVKECVNEASKHLHGYNVMTALD